MSCVTVRTGAGVSLLLQYRPVRTHTDRTLVCRQAAMATLCDIAFTRNDL